MSHRPVLEIGYDESGQGVAEYALLIATIVALVVLVMFAFRSDLVDLINATGDYLSSQQPT